MITLSKTGNAVKFTFDDNGHYLQNGTIEVPVNSLALIMDDSDMVTFRKSASNDIFVSANYAEFGMSKSELEAWYKTNMVGSSGGGGGTGGTTPEEVQQMIDTSLTPYSTTNEVDSMIDEATSGKAETTAVTQSISEATSGKADTTAVTQSISEAVSGKADTTAVTQSINEAVSGKVDNSTYTSYTAATSTALDNKADKSEIPSVSGYADSVAFNDTSKYVEFYHGGTSGTKVYEFNAAPFLIDGMVQNVEIKDVTISGESVTCLVISFNTDAGKQDINIPISEVFDANNYYTKTEVDAALSAKSDTTAVTQNILEATSGKADSSTVDSLSGTVTAHTANTDIHVTAEDKTVWNAKSDFSGSYNDLTDKPTIPTVPTSNTAFTNDAGYITEDALSGYAESSAVTEEITAAVSGKADSTSVYTKSEVDNAISAATDDMATETWVGEQGYITGVDLSDYATTAYVDGAVSGKVETSAITSAVTSASTDSEIPTAKAVFDAIPTGGTGGGKAIEAGRGITVTTGETADTVSFDLPISAGTGSNSLKLNEASTASGSKSIAGGQWCTASANGAIALGQMSTASHSWAVAIGNACNASGKYSMAVCNTSTAIGEGSFAEGERTIANNNSEHASGRYNVSNTGSTDADKTLFSVGNGTADNARHNAFEIRQNGDIYYFDGTNDVKLQDKFSSLDTTIGDINTILESI